MNKEVALANSASKTGADWKRFFLLAVVILPILTICLIGAYGFAVWFMQLLFWGPPS